VLLPQSIAMNQRRSEDTTFEHTGSTREHARGKRRPDQRDFPHFCKVVDAESFSILLGHKGYRLQKAKKNEVAIGQVNQFETETGPFRLANTSRVAFKA